MRVLVCDDMRSDLDSAQLPMGVVHTADSDFESSPYVDIADLARAHWQRERTEAETKYGNEADAYYAKVRRDFQHQHGEIVSEYWTTFSPSGVVLTVSSLPSRPPSFDGHAPKLHRATDWHLRDEEAEAAAAAVFHRCDVLAIRARESLSAVPLRIVMQSLFTTVAYTLTRLDRAPEPPTEVPLSDGSAESEQFPETRKELERLERYIQSAEQYAAIRRYYIGALAGLATILLATLAVELPSHLTPFRDAAAASIAAGAVGALIAALQRAASSRFTPPSEVGPTTLFVIGALG